jgi:TrpR-related protein YerC/YecD
MDKLHCEAVDKLFKAVLSLETIDECYAFFEDVCTVKEILDISQRLEVAAFLKKGMNYAAVSSQTGASTATISRVNKCLSYGADGYKIVLERLEENSNDNNE